jgi:4-hydroxythreonine-4-phosphate dehydrogenase
MPDQTRPRVAITLGDAAGVGPEVCVKALADPEVRRTLRPLLVGPWEIAREAARFSDPPLALRRVGLIAEATFPEDETEVLGVGDLTPASVPVGKLSAAAGAAAVAAVETAAKLALAGEVEAVVTAPLNKEGMRLAGVSYPGHTEILADLARVRSARMLLVSGPLRVCHVTVHVSLREALDLVRRERIVATIRDAAAGLARLGIDAPHLAVAGLNPHAGEGGMFGSEEIEEIAPACADAQAAGLRVSGPLPPDTVFMRAARGEFDGVIAMYHDQGHIPIKLFGFDQGVNITLGLPFIRTSVDHGTAYDIAGRGVADPASMKEALRLAVLMASHKVAVPGGL